MTHYTISVDAGNGGTNAVLDKGNGKTTQFYEPSVRAAATGESLGLGEQWEQQYSYVDWNNHRYVTGDDVVRITRRGLERHMGGLRYGDEFHQFLVANAVAKLGVKSGEVDLTLFAPPGMFTEARDMMIERFLDRKAVEISITSPKGKATTHTFSYDNVSVYPEGIGAAACFVIDDKGKWVSTDIFEGEVIILDAGAFTLDALKLVNGNFSPETLEHATWQDGGIDVHVRQPIVRTLKKKSDDFVNLTVDDIDRVIRNGLVTDDYTLKIAGYEVNLQPLVEKQCERHAEWIANNICDGVFNGFRGIKSVILVGGGAPLIMDYMQKWYGDKILDTKKHATTKKIHPVDMNAVGGLRLALARIQQT